MNLRKNLIVLSFTLAAINGSAQAQEKEYQDMSDPMAVFTQAGAGITDKGINVKIGQTYDTGSVTTMGMNIFEFKGGLGDSFGIRDNDEPLYETVDNSLDSIRYRNFEVDMTNGRGSQIDANLNIDKETVDLSYSLIQALPKWGFAQLYPLAGVGLTAANDSEDGLKLPGTFAAVGFYGKFTLTDNLWVNYNPLWLTTLTGSDKYQNENYAGDSQILTHEVAVSYQFTPRFNLRYFSNWNEHVSFSDGDHRIEFNYQF